MKRNMDLVRSMLLAMEEERGFQHLLEDGVSKETLNYHAFLIYDAGLASGQAVNCDGDPVPSVFLDCLTWQGHEFLDVA